MAEDLIDLGFSFNVSDALKKADTLNGKLESLRETADRMKQAAAEAFGSSNLAGMTGFADSLKQISSEAVNGRNALMQLNRVIPGIARSLPKLNFSNIRPLNPQVVLAMHQFASSLEQAAVSIPRFRIPTISAVDLNRLQKLELIHFERMRPIPDSVINSVQRLAGPLSGLNGAGLNFNFPKNPFPVGNADRFADSLRNAHVEVDDLAIKMAGAFTTGVAGRFLMNSIRMANQFGEQLIYVKTLATDFDLEKVRSGVLGLSSALGGANELMRAYYDAYSAGIRGTEQQNVEFTRIAAQMAAVIRSDVLTATDALTSAMNSYGISVKDAGTVANVLFRIVDLGKANGQQLANSFGQISSTAATAGLSLDELGAAIATVSKVIPARNAITFLNNAIGKMIRPTKDSREAAQSLGVEFGLTAVRAKGFGNMMQEIFAASRNNQEALLRLFPDLRGQRAMLQLLGNGWADYNANLRAFQTEGDKASVAMKALNDNINYQLNGIPNTLQKIRISAGEVAISVLTLGGALSPVISAFNEMTETEQRVVGGLLLVATGYVIYRGAMLAMHSMQALEIRNKAILAEQLGSESQGRYAAATAAVTEMRSKQALLSENVRQAQAKVAIAQADEKLALAETNLAKAQALGAMRQVRMATDQVQLNAARANEVVVLNQLTAAQERYNAAKANTAATKAAFFTASLRESTSMQMSGGTPVSNELFSKSMLANASPRSENLSSSILLNVNAEKQAAAAAALSTAEQQRNAAAAMIQAQAAEAAALKTGNYAEAARQGAIAQQQLTAATQLSGEALKQNALHNRLAAQAETFHHLAARQRLFTMKANTAQSIVASQWNRTLADSNGLLALSYRGITIGANAARTAVVGLWSAFWPMLALGGAIWAIQKAFEALDLTGERALENARKAAEKWDSVIKEAGEREDSARKGSDSDIDAAKRLMALSQLDHLGTSGMKAAQEAAAQLAKRNGDLEISYDKLNDRLVINGNLMDRVVQNNVERVRAPLLQKIAAARQKAAEFGGAYENSLQDTRRVDRTATGREGYDRNIIYPSVGVNFSGLTYSSRAALGEGANKALKSLRALLEENRNLDKEMKDKVIANAMYEAAIAVDKLREKIKGLMADYAFGKLSDVDKISFRAKEIANLGNEIGKYNVDIANGNKVQADGKTPEEKAYQADLDRRNKFVELEKINQRIQKQSEDMRGGIDDYQFSVKMQSARNFGGSEKVINDRIGVFQKKLADALGKKDYQAALNAQKSIYDLQSKEVDIRERLANAARAANDNTLKLIQSMDKFRNFNVNATDANSADAMDLQNRGFGAFTSPKLLTGAYNAANNARNALAADATDPNGGMERLRAQILQWSQGAQSQVNAANQSIVGTWVANPRNSSLPAPAPVPAPVAVNVPETSKEQVAFMTDVRKKWDGQAAQLEKMEKGIADIHSTLKIIAQKAGITIVSANVG